MRTKATFLKSAFFWLTLFFVLVAAPLVLALVGHQEESRGFWIEFGVGLGFVGLAMMGLQFLLTARYSKIGFTFRAGQFVWVTLGNTPFKLQQHPFTISSSAEKKKIIRFTIKELGDFTSEISTMEPGTTAFVEGPYGNFTLSESTATHNIFITGGIGITPAMSILNTLRDRRDRRKITLIFGTPNRELTPFFEELKVLSAELNLEVVHVLEESDGDWDGETGFITEEILKKYTPEDFTSCEYFICGPPLMMNAVEPVISGWGVPVHKIHSERFNIV
ncbi:MAG: hypothetical protein EA359_13980 [Balneolaceae bacterium]|nr:MAG: hypothetical protein EA359_13980 [Balneolaceae bacterium]